MGCVESAPTPQLPPGGTLAKDQYPGSHAKSSQIDKDLQEMFEKDRKIRKLLLLGAGESGKSTLFKQTRTIYGNAFSDTERLDYLSTIADNILTGIQKLISETREEKMQSDASVVEAVENLKKLDPRDHTSIDPSIGHWIELVWNHQSIQETYENRADFQLIDSIRYYCENIRRIAREDYIPTFQDILQSRRVTVGVTEMNVRVNGKILKLVDVGGQRSFRAKWLFQFAQCTAVIFVVAINEYDQVLVEDEETNRVMEALNLFSMVCHNMELYDLNLILFLNKRDLFEEKFLRKRIPLESCFPDYTGGFDMKNACTFITSKFEQENPNANRDIYAHVTCATDTNNVKRVMTDLTDMIIQSGLEHLGIIAQ